MSREKDYCGLCEHLTEEVEMNNNQRTLCFYCPIINKEVSYTGKTCEEFKEREKVELKDIIGCVEEKYPTNSVLLKKQVYHPDRFKYEKSRIGFGKGAIYDTVYDETYEESTSDMLDLMNYLDFENINTKDILNDFMELIYKIQELIPENSVLEDLNQKDFTELLKLCNVGREMLYMQDFKKEET